MNNYKNFIFYSLGNFSNDTQQPSKRVNLANPVQNLKKLLTEHSIRDLCINMSNHQNAIFRQLDNFIKHSHSFAMTIFHKITNSEKLVILLIIPTYAKVSV